MMAGNSPSSVGKTPDALSSPKASSTNFNDEEIDGGKHAKKEVKFLVGGDPTPFGDDGSMNRREEDADIPLDGGASIMPVSSIRPCPIGKSQSATAITDQDRQLFVELFELHTPEAGDEDEWEETARWIRYEEDVEGADHRWGRPHVAFLAFHSLLQLRFLILKGAMMLGAPVGSYEDICQHIVNAMSTEYGMDENTSKAIRIALERKHKHAAEPRPLFGFRGSLIAPGSMRRADHSQTAPSMAKTESATIRKSPSSKSIAKCRSARSISGACSTADLVRELHCSGAESAQVFVGVLKELRKVRFCMLRLDRGIFIPELLDAHIPVRFIFVIVGPPLPDVDYHEMGRSVATLMSNSTFQDIAYLADSRTSLLAGLDRFLDGSLVIPPGEIEKKSLLSVDAIKKALRRRSQQNRLEKSKRKSVDETQTKDVLQDSREALVEKSKPYYPLQRIGRPFWGVINDVKHRFPSYGSDFKDALHFQCLTSLVFMFFATFAPAISFGGLLGEKVDGWMGPSEVLVAQCICGVIWGLFSCQPLIIMAATGPLMVFEEGLYNFCKSNGLEFMVMRVWTSAWIVLLSVVTTCFEGSFLVRYITRFTEDIFASLISTIFCVESLKFMINNFKTNPVRNLHAYCSLMDAAALFRNSSNTSDAHNESIIVDLESNRSLHHRTLMRHVRDQPDTALLSAVFMLGTFALAFALRQLRTSVFFGRTMRRALGDFGVPIALGIVVLLDELVFTEPYLELLSMPDDFSTTDPSKRGWYINPMGINASFPYWAMAAAAIPAILVYILIFVEVEITELLLTKKERGLRKGSGFHYDLILAGLLSMLCGLLGLPWMCAAAVQSLAHASSLTVMRKNAPGERPKVDRVLEQRVTTIGVALLTGSCAFLGFVLKNIPLATLLGIFLYLGIISMIGVEFLYRIILMFMPQKYHPDVPYCKKVRMWRMHMYTCIQVVCLAVLLIVKMIKVTLVLPFLLMLLAVFRKCLLPKIFTKIELDALDGHDDENTDDESSESEQSRDFYQEAILPI